MKHNKDILNFSLCNGKQLLSQVCSYHSCHTLFMVFDMIQCCFFLLVLYISVIFIYLCKIMAFYFVVKVKPRHLLFDLLALLTNLLVTDTKTQAAQLMLLQMPF